MEATNLKLLSKLTPTKELIAISEFVGLSEENIINFGDLRTGRKRGHKYTNNLTHINTK